MSEWVDWLRWGAPELARRVNALDASPVCTLPRPETR